MDTIPEQPAPRVDSTLSKGLLVLEALNAAGTSRGVSDLSRSLGLTKSNTFRLLQTLTHLGYVRREPDKTYKATLKTWTIGRAVVENLNLRPVARPMMQFLSDETQETIYLAVRDGLQVIYLDKIESLKPIRSWNPIGGTAPIHCVGTGKALLAANYRGFAIDQGEFRPQIFSLGAAILMPDGQPVGALGVSVPDVNLGEGDIERVGALVQHAARTVSEKLTRL